MDPILEYSTLHTIGRLALAAILGGVIGLDREASGKPAGFRTNILICVGAALLTQLSIDIARRWVVTYDQVADPGRIAAQIVTGIGFLGAGTIIQSRHGVRGLTTAATIWVVAAIGMAVGGGGYLLAVAATLGAVITLALLERVERWIEPYLSDARWIRVTFEGTNPDVHREIANVLHAHRGRVRNLEVERKAREVRLSFRVQARNADWNELLDAVLREEGVTGAALE